MSASQFLDGRLAQLQNLIKREPDAYHDEFILQHRHFQSELEIFRLKPGKNSAHFAQLAYFLCQVSTCYPDDLEGLPELLAGLIEEHYDALDPKVRITLVHSLILLQAHRGVLGALPLFKTCFLLFRVQDKKLRKLLYSHVLADIRGMHKKGGQQKELLGLQSYLYSVLDDRNEAAAVKALEVMMELYRRQVREGERESKGRMGG